MHDECDVGVFWGSHIWQCLKNMQLLPLRMTFIEIANIKMSFSVGWTLEGVSVYSQQVIAVILFHDKAPRVI